MKEIHTGETNKIRSSSAMGQQQQQQQQQQQRQQQQYAETHAARQPHEQQECLKLWLSFLTCLSKCFLSLSNSRMTDDTETLRSEEILGMNDLVLHKKHIHPGNAIEASHTTTHKRIALSPRIS